MSELRNIDECGMEKFRIPYIREKTIAILRDSDGGRKRRNGKGTSLAKRFYVIY